MKLLLTITITTLLFLTNTSAIFADPPTSKAVSESFGSLDPLITNNPTGNHSIQTVGDIISRLLPYLLTFAGLILFGMLIMGGFTMLTAATNPKQAEAGKQRITTAIVGFIIIFAAYWLMQIVEIVFGVSIL